MLAAVFTGLTAGAVHVLSGPDHLAAVAPMAIDQHARAVNTGWRWGCGHAAGVGLVGALFVWLRDTIFLQELVTGAETITGFVLVAIGLYGFRLALATRVHSHEHVHNDVRHIHIHAHPAGARHLAGSDPHFHSHSAFFVGALHGFAGGSHFWAVLPALAFPSLTGSVLYLASYCAGSILAMAGFSCVLAQIGVRLTRNGRIQLFRTGMIGVSLITTVVGVGWVLR